MATVQRAYIEKRIYFVRSQRVIIDTDLATLYRVPTKVFNQAVRRNMLRFPADFMFQLTSDETEVTDCDLKLGRPALPAFRIHGTGCRHAL
jgi:ORF6N domain